MKGRLIIHLGLEPFVRRNHRVWYNGTMYQKKKPVVAFDVIDLAVELDWTSGIGQVALMNKNFQIAIIKALLLKMKNEREVKTSWYGIICEEESQGLVKWDNVPEEKTSCCFRRH